MSGPRYKARCKKCKLLFLGDFEGEKLFSCIGCGVPLRVTKFGPRVASRSKKLAIEIRNKDLPLFIDNMGGIAGQGGVPIKGGEGSNPVRRCRLCLGPLLDARALRAGRRLIAACGACAEVVGPVRRVHWAMPGLNEGDGSE